MRDKQTPFSAGQEESTSPSKQVVIVTGMHRSGTSLVAAILQSAGVDMGSRLLGPHPSNPQGHFEDLDFLELHKACLRRLNRSIIVRDPRSLEGFTPPERDRARALIEARAGKSLWGWKDPRSALFLESWGKLLPDANWVFLYRQPMDVVLSLLRRGSDPEVVLQPKAGLDAWKAYNREILRFLERETINGLLMEIGEIAADPNAFVRKLRSRFELPLGNNDTSCLVQPERPRATGPSTFIDSIIEALDTEARRILAALRQRTDHLYCSNDNRASPHQVPQHSAALEGLNRLVSRGELDERQTATAFGFLLALLDPSLESHRQSLLNGASLRIESPFQHVYS